ncbi:hypothetical protein MC885_020617 [Smutsia gigantea]|nr:hypothetical protein MC885_020617 [Smutsia gigantea]
MRGCAGYAGVLGDGLRFWRSLLVKELPEPLHVRSSHLKASGDPHETEKLRTAFFAVPVEMRFLNPVSSGVAPPVLCVAVMWRVIPAAAPEGVVLRPARLVTICDAGGEVGLLVTCLVPRTPFFWALHVTESVSLLRWHCRQALHQNMQVLFSAPAEAEQQQPYLRDRAVRHGTRCLAECPLGDYGPACSRCWVLDRVDSWAVAMFIDFGRPAPIPVQSLHSLDSSDFWTIPPPDAAVLLEKDVLGSYQVVHHILKGKITGALNLEGHGPVSPLSFPSCPRGLSGRPLLRPAAACFPGIP